MLTYVNYQIKIGSVCSILGAVEGEGEVEDEDEGDTFAIGKLIANL